MYLRDTLRLPAKGLCPSAHPFFITLLGRSPGKNNGEMAVTKAWHQTIDVVRQPQQKGLEALAR